MDKSNELTLEQFIERSKALVRQADKLKREQEKLVAELEAIRERTNAGKHPKVS